MQAVNNSSVTMSSYPTHNNEGVKEYWNNCTECTQGAFQALGQFFGSARSTASSLTIKSLKFIKTGLKPSVAVPYLLAAGCLYASYQVLTWSEEAEEGTKNVPRYFDYAAKVVVDFLNALKDQIPEDAFNALENAVNDSFNVTDSFLQYAINSAESGVNSVGSATEDALNECVDAINQGIPASNPVNHVHISNARFSVNTQFLVNIPEMIPNTTLLEFPFSFYKATAPIIEKVFLGPRGVGYSLGALGLLFAGIGMKNHKIFHFLTKRIAIPSLRCCLPSTGKVLLDSLEGCFKKGHPLNEVTKKRVYLCLTIGILLGVSYAYFNPLTENFDENAHHHLQEADNDIQKAIEYVLNKTNEVIEEGHSYLQNEAASADNQFNSFLNSKNLIGSSSWFNGLEKIINDLMANMRSAGFNVDNIDVSDLSEVLFNQARFLQNPLSKMIEKLGFVIDFPTDKISLDKTFGPVVDFIGGALDRTSKFLFYSSIGFSTYAVAQVGLAACTYKKRKKPRVNLPKTHTSSVSHSQMNYGVTKADLENRKTKLENLEHQRRKLEEKIQKMKKLPPIPVAESE